LVISPSGTQIKTVHTGAMFTCSVVDYEPPADWTTGPSMRWLGPGHVPVTATRGRSDTFSVFDIVEFGSLKDGDKILSTSCSAISVALSLGICSVKLTA